MRVCFYCSILMLLLGQLGAQERACFEKSLEKEGEVSVYQVHDRLPAFYFLSGMSIDADGSPRAYHPEDTGLDALQHAGKAGHWWGIATYTDSLGQEIPYVQDSLDPYPGYYVSTTSLTDARYREWDPRKYVNSEKIPYIVLPARLAQATGTRLGDLAYVYNRANGKSTAAIYADTGPAGKLGEGSIYLAKQLGIDANPRRGGTEENVVYVVFPGSGNRQPRLYDEMKKEVEQFLRKEEIKEFFKTCLKE